ncbi:MAG: hypothetical protein U1D30_25610 [Planctomycetota bacterium]
MHTTGLVVLLGPEPNAAEQSLEQIRAAGPFTLGQRQDRCLPVVLEAEGPTSARDWHEWTQSLAGVEGVEVVFVHWHDEGEEEHHEPC